LQSRALVKTCGQESFSGAWFPHRKHWFGPFQIASFGQGSIARRRDVRRPRKVELFKRLHPEQVRILDPI
jgi:hypothetical protein